MVTSDLRVSAAFGRGRDVRIKLSNLGFGSKPACDLLPNQAAKVVDTERGGLLGKT